MSRIDMVFKKFVLAKSGGTNGALVGQVSRFESLHVVLAHVVQKFPLKHFATDRTPARILALVGQVLHAGSHQTMRTKQMSLKTLEKTSVLT
jgi:hypothetical protein